MLKLRANVSHLRSLISFVEDFFELKKQVEFMWNRCQVQEVKETLKHGKKTEFKLKLNL